MAIIFGTSGDDTISILGNSAGVTGGTPTSGGDIISSGAGNDFIVAGYGNDTLIGDAGSDTFDGGGGIDVLDYSAFTSDLVIKLSSIAAGTITDTATGDIDSFINARVFNLGSGNDSFSGSQSAETVFGGAGNDTINGNSSPDYLDGGAGDDYFFAEGGSDTLIGGDGYDTLDFSKINVAITGTSTSMFSFNSGSDVISGFENYKLGLRNDVFTGGDAGESVTGGTGNDSISGAGGNDQLDGGTGNDTLDGGAGNDFLAGKDGNDRVSGGEGDDVIYGGNGSDILDGGDGIDTLNYREFIPALTVNVTSPGNGTINDGAFVDNFTGFEKYVLGTAADIFFGSVGDDIVTGAKGNDLLFGGDGNDIFIFATGDGLDTISGGSGTDKLQTIGRDVPITGAMLSNISGVEIIEGIAPGTRIIGGSAGETLDLSGYTLINVQNIDGANGNDIINGSAGNDKIFGGAGADTLTGFGGDDTFAYLAATHSAILTSDHITDFAAGDLIDLSIVDANSRVVGTQAFNFIGSAAFSNVAGELRAVAGLIQGDVNGDGKADFQIILDNNYIATGADFLLGAPT